MPATRLGRLVSEWRDGSGRVVVQADAAGLLVFTLITAVGEGLSAALFVPWVSEVLHGDNRLCAALLSAQAVGGIIGAFVVARFLHNVTPGMLLGIGTLVFGLIDLVIFTYPLIVPIVWPRLVGMVIVGVPTAAMGVGIRRRFSRPEPRIRTAAVSWDSFADRRARSGWSSARCSAVSWATRWHRPMWLVLQGSGYRVGGVARPRDRRVGPRARTTSSCGQMALDRRCRAATGH